MSVAPNPSVHEAFSEIVNRHQAAWNAHDPDGLISLFTDDLDFVNVVGTHHRSKQSLLQEFRHLHATFMRNSQLRVTEHTVRELAPGVGLGHAHWEMTGVDKVPGWNVTEPRRGVLTYVIVARDGGWKVTAVQNTDVLPLPMPQ